MATMSMIGDGDNSVQQKSLVNFRLENSSTNKEEDNSVQQLLSVTIRSENSSTNKEEDDSVQQHLPTTIQSKKSSTNRKMDNSVQNLSPALMAKLREIDDLAQKIPPYKSSFDNFFSMCFCYSCYL